MTGLKCHWLNLSVVGSYREFLTKGALVRLAIEEVSLPTVNVGGKGGGWKPRGKVISHRVQS